MDIRKSFFDKAAAKWDQNVPDYRASPFFRRWLASQNLCGVCMEIGCGTGRAIPQLTEKLKSGSVLIGMDYSHTMLRHAHGSAGAGRQWLVEGDARNMPFPSAQFDHVLILNTFPHLKPFDAVLAEIYRILKPHGRCQIVHFASRSHINEVHTALPEVSGDLLPAVSELSVMAERLGFQPDISEDAPDYYWFSIVK